MTVAELKEALAKYPDDMEVYFEGEPENYFPVEYIESIYVPGIDTELEVLVIGSFQKTE